MVNILQGLLGGSPVIVGNIDGRQQENSGIAQIMQAVMHPFIQISARRTPTTPNDSADDPRPESSVIRPHAPNTPPGIGEMLREMRRMVELQEQAVALLTRIADRQSSPQVQVFVSGSEIDNDRLDEIRRIVGSDAVATRLSIRQPSGSPATSGVRGIQRLASGDVERVLDETLEEADQVQQLPEGATAALGRGGEARGERQD
jgi:hypothetical protein